MTWILVISGWPSQCDNATLKPHNPILGEQGNLKVSKWQTFTSFTFPQCRLRENLFDKNLSHSQLQHLSPTLHTRAWWSRFWVCEIWRKRWDRRNDVFFPDFCRPKTKGVELVCGSRVVHTMSTTAICAVQSSPQSKNEKKTPAVFESIESIHYIHWNLPKWFGSQLSCFFRSVARSQLKKLLFNQLKVKETLVTQSSLWQ